MTRGACQLTLVVPVYNRAGLVERTLQSIAAQRRIDEVAIILVDNASTDGSTEVLARWAAREDNKRLQVTILSEPKRGAGAARNCGLRASVTPFVMFFDSDDEMCEGLIDMILSHIELHPDVDVMGWPINIETTDCRHRTGVFETRWPMWHHLVHGSMSTQRFCCRRELINAVGGWPEDLPTWDDLELGVRLLLAEPKMAKLTEQCMVKANFTPESLTGLCYSAKHGAWEKALRRCAAHLEDAGVSSRWVDVRLAILAADYAREGSRQYSRELMARLLRGRNAMERLALQLVWLKQRMMPRGTHMVASLMFGRNIGRKGCLEN